MIPQEWIDKYCLKSGDDRIIDTPYAHTCEEGFATWNIVEDAIVVVQCFGNGKYWLRFFKEMASKADLKIRFVTARNPKAFARSMGAKVIGHLMEIE